ncbi:RHS repeat-associated core domain-containing protein [Pseudomonas japonica]|uniref:RHS repeat-associated core domain-containing protein n=1 Tax=Pseudomonas japonica TaxID=256466 RepID=A0A239B2J3_9PSED|nr:RHS repeat-associated core domain-containing protein [Pseudomonas japonica]
MSNDRLALLACTLHQSPLRAVAGGHLQDIVHGPYGHRREPHGLPGSGFNGQWREPETGWYLLGNGYRAYNPVLMRFNSADSLSPFGRGGLNAYGYCLGDPVNRLDPDGHAPVFAFLRQISRVLNRSSLRRGIKHKRLPSEGNSPLTSTTSLASGSSPSTSMTALSTGSAQAMSTNDDGALGASTLQSLHTAAGVQATPSETPGHRPVPTRPASQADVTMLGPLPVLPRSSNPSPFSRTVLALRDMSLSPRSDGTPRRTLSNPLATWHGKQAFKRHRELTAPPPLSPFDSGATHDG